MLTLATQVNEELAAEVVRGLLSDGQKRFSPRFFYDDLGSSLFEAITLLPEYGLTRADERLLRRHASDLVKRTGPVSTVCELGSGSGRKTRLILQALKERSPLLLYRPIDVSAAALESCQKELGDVAEVDGICADWLEGLIEIASQRGGEPLLLLFLGSSIGNLDRDAIPDLLTEIRASLRPGDLFLLGADLVKKVETMLAAYDDPTGVTAAFNLNLLGRVNRELDADFDLRSFSHEVRWNEEERRIEMHLMSARKQVVRIRALDADVHFEAGETIWTESSHKFTIDELRGLAASHGFDPLAAWQDREWPFAELLWKVK